MKDTAESDAGKATEVVVIGADELQRLIVASVTAALREMPPPRPPSGLVGVVKKHRLAGLLDVSVASIDRFVREGMPCDPVGTGKRFDFVACRAWLAARGKKAPTPPKKVSAPDDVDLSSVLQRGGLRAIGGTR